MEGGSKIDGLVLNVEKEDVNDSVTETNLVDNRLKMNNHNSNQNQVVMFFSNMSFNTPHSSTFIIAMYTVVHCNSLRTFVA